MKHINLVLKRVIEKSVDPKYDWAKGKKILNVGRGHYINFEDLMYCCAFYRDANWIGQNYNPWNKFIAEPVRFHLVDYESQEEIDTEAKSIWSRN